METIVNIGTETLALVPNDNGKSWGVYRGEHTFIGTIRKARLAGVAGDLYDVQAPGQPWRVGYCTHAKALMTLATLTTKGGQ